MIKKTLALNFKKPEAGFFPLKLESLSDPENGFSSEFVVIVRQGVYQSALW